ncbi:hypothetical protein L211DRAFT_847168 [Terfezia boudieri ATCC MYA-4762]|uniref:Uncharacterized protein n=1 Tax=Terfezia boudieri ATCC MYA-4762 TaxID=1051890 RepID=A0A3N4LUJ4_9PEZI|nr:hypothetical protein L211DRAFT_847168 [Terfezia boudieri ATCC MYA-4762]
MAYAHLFKPEQFSGEKNTIGVEDFLDSLDLSFSCLDAIADETKREKAKLLTLQGHLEADKKVNFALAANTLRQCFPTRNDAMGAWSAKARVVVEMNVLTQGTLTSEQYIEKASDLFAMLGNEYSVMLATKFVDGIGDMSTKVTIDAQFEEAYQFPEMLRIYEKCTKSLRRTETASQ